MVRTEPRQRACREAGPVASGKDRRGKIPAEIAERRRKALDLRKAGASYDAIAQQLRLSGSGSAYKIVQAALKATYREPADDVRKLELERLDRLTLALWSRAQQGETEAIDRVLKLMDRRAKLLGLDAPAKSESEVRQTGGISTVILNPPPAHAAEGADDRRGKRR